MHARQRISRSVLLGIAMLTLALNLSAESLENVARAAGFAPVKLQRRFGNHLFLNASVNGRPAALMIDTSASATVIHRASAGTFALQVNGSAHPVKGVFGEAVNDYGRSTLASLQLGDRMLTNVAVRIADQAARVDPPEFLPITKLKWNAKRKDLHLYTRIDSVDGLLGSDVLRECGAVVDCGHQMLYLRTSGSAQLASERIAAFLANRGFARIPMRRGANGRYEVPGNINGHATTLIVDSGSSFTLLARHTAGADGVFSAPVRFAYNTGGNHLEPLNLGTVRRLSIGSFQLENADVNVANVTADLLGIDELSMNFAVLDFASSALYLRHPDRR